MRTALSIPGMHCASCAALIEDVTSEFPAVREVEIDLAAKAVTLTHDESFDLDAWKSEVHSLGDAYAVFPA